MKAAQVWQAALGELQLQMTKPTFDTWVRPARVFAHEDGEFIISVPNAYNKDWLERRLLSSIKRSLAGILGHSVDVSFIVLNEEQRAEPQALLNGGELGSNESSRAPLLSNGNGHSRSNARAVMVGNLNSRYVFETFVVGPSNRLAHAACLAVAERPASTYNPLFLYGGVGLGKTHLLHAIGHQCQTSGLEVLYVSSEQFTNDLINAIRTQDTGGFRDKYRTIDVLLIDDIQFIAGKESTQEEFFHTFNALHGSGKQIVISSDRPPKSMLTLEERLRSRFEWGLIADIQLPDIETRIAILRAKAEGQTAVPSEVLEFIARQVQSNIRELEGALNRVIAYVQLTGNSFSVDSASAALADLVARPSSLTVNEIILAVASFYNVPTEDLVGRGRSKELVKPRQVAMYLCREEMQATLPLIGAALGGRDHTTVMYGVEKISREVEQDDNLRREILGIRDRLYNRNSVR
ncbi:MAG TPA: chromosomal replication initiator protein DnaA [Anaerolineae bacterium]|nr:chromosomal replication initiator protein DnaA [Anaerolineae bacterium]